MTHEAPVEPTTVEPARAHDDVASWATPTVALSVGEMPAGAVNRNVAGRRLVGPVQGFGQLWQKTYRIRLERDALTPADVIREWKANYASYWPKGNRFYAPPSGIQPGGVALINAASLGGVQLSTGIEVIYADDESFAFMNAEGHPAAGMVTFSAASEAAAVIAQVQVRNWAKPVRNREATDREGAINANVRGRRLNAANGGFGRLFQKTFTVQVGSHVTPEEVIQVWKTRFGEFWPKGQKMFLSPAGIAPG